MDCIFILNKNKPYDKVLRTAQLSALTWGDDGVSLSLTVYLLTQFARHNLTHGQDLVHSSTETIPLNIIITLKVQRVSMSVQTSASLSDYLQK